MWLPVVIIASSVVGYRQLKISAQLGVSSTGVEVIQNRYLMQARAGCQGTRDLLALPLFFAALQTCRCSLREFGPPVTDVHKSYTHP